MAQMNLSNTRAKPILALAAMACFGLLAAGCTHHAHPHTVPNWSGTGAAPATPSYSDNAPATISQPSYGVQTVAAAVDAGRYTFTSGCSGNYSTRDAATNRELSRGRAFNSGRGLVALDAQGRQTTPLSSSNAQIVTFLPDCNCRNNGGARVSSQLSPSQTAALGVHAPVCSAG